MVILFTLAYLALCGLAYWGWNDWVVSGEGTPLKSQIIVKSRVGRILLRISMLTLGPLWVFVAIMAVLYALLICTVKAFLGSLVK